MISGEKVDWADVGIIAAVLLLIVVLFYLMNRKQITKDQWMEKQRQQGFPLQNAPQKKANTTVLNAYERMMVFLDRIEVNKLAQRVQPISSKKGDYANFLIQHIDQEFDFNLSQQLYISEEAWALILTAKNTSIQLILKNSLPTTVETAFDLQRNLLQHKDNSSVIQIAKNRLKQEISFML